MDRRFFLKLTGFVAAAGAFEVLPVAAQGLTDTTGPGAEGGGLQAPGTYQITGRVRLQAPVVEISGVTNAQQISWSEVGSSRAPVTGFTSFEYFDKPWHMPEIRVRGGQLETLSVVAVDIA
jgi:hypothetical protein